jgi:hypothetical protein
MESKRKIKIVKKFEFVMTEYEDGKTDFNMKRENINQMELIGVLQIIKDNFEVEMLNMFKQKINE